MLCIWSVSEAWLTVVFGGDVDLDAADEHGRQLLDLVERRLQPLPVHLVRQLLLTTVYLFRHLRQHGAQILQSNKCRNDIPRTYVWLSCSIHCKCVVMAYFLWRLTLTNVTRSSMLSTTSVMARYSSTFLHIRMILRTSDSSKASSSADVPCRMPYNKHAYVRVCVEYTWGEC